MNDDYSLEMIVVGVSHRTAPIELREFFSVADRDSSALLDRLNRPHGASEYAVGEYFVLSTCNRTEVFALVQSPLVPKCDRDVRDALLTWVEECSGNIRGFAELRGRLEDALFSLRGRHSVAHLFQLASGLDSAILGEAQILGQLKSALDSGRARRTLGPVMDRVGQRAIRAAKRVRTETGIGRRAVSVGYAAAELAKQIFGDLRGAKVLLVGAGETASLTIRHLHFAGARDITVANRSYERAQLVAAPVGGLAVKLASVAQLSTASDILIFCAQVSRDEYLYTKAHATRESLERQSRPRFVIDLGLPRNVDPALSEVDDLFLYTLDDLHGVIRENLDAREIEAKEAARLLEFEVESCLAWMERLPQEERIARFWRHLSTLQRAEERRFIRALGKESLGEAGVTRACDAFHRSSTSLIRKIFSRSMESLRCGGREEVLSLLLELPEWDEARVRDQDSRQQAALIPFEPRPRARSASSE